MFIKEGIWMINMNGEKYGIIIVRIDDKVCIFFVYKFEIYIIVKCILIIWVWIYWFVVYYL